MGDYASKGLANGVGIPALVLGSLGFLQSGGLGNGIFGNYNNSVASTAMSAALSQKDSEIAKLSAEKYTDNKISETYISLNNHFKTGHLPAETAINILNESIYILQTFIIFAEHDKRQIIALLKRSNIFFINLTAFGRNQTA